MRFDQEIRNHCVVIRPDASRLDAIAAPVFRESVTSVASEHRCLIVIDLVNIEFMDSSGLGAVIGCYKALQETGGLALCNVQEDVKAVFKLTHMDRIFDIHDDYDTCVNSKAA